MARNVIEIEMDKVRYLQVGINTMISLEKELGKPLSELGEETLGLGDMRTIFYCMLKPQDKKLTLEKVGDLLDEAIQAHGMEYLSDKLSKALSTAFGGGAAVPSVK